MGSSYLEWSDAFGVGHESLDAEHRNLVDLINDIHAAVTARQPYEKIAAMLDALKRQTEEHMLHENSILGRINSGPVPSTADRLAFLKATVEAALEEHVANHRQSLADLKKLIRRFGSELNAEASLLCQALRAWFIDHALNRDAALREVFRFLPKDRFR